MLIPLNSHVEQQPIKHVLRCGNNATYPQIGGKKGMAGWHLIILRIWPIVISKTERKVCQRHLMEKRGMNVQWLEYVLAHLVDKRADSQGAALFF
jgi:hypothetical protein